MSRSRPGLRKGVTGMSDVLSMFRRARFAVLMLAGLALGACAANNPIQGQAGVTGAAGAAAPGSQQDFVVNVGDRVFFETDSVDLTPQARATLDKQVQWLQMYNRYAFTIEGHADER